MAGDRPKGGSTDDTELSLTDLEVIEETGKVTAPKPPPRPRSGLGRARPDKPEHAVVSTLRDGAPPPPPPGVITPTADRPRAPVPPAKRASARPRPPAPSRPETEASAMASFVAPSEATVETASPDPSSPETERPPPPTADASFAELCEQQLSVEPDPERKARLHYELGRHCEIALRELAKAADHYRAALRLSPDNAAAVRGARRALAALGRHAELPPLFDAEVAITREPSVRARLLYGKASVMEARLRQPGPALAVYREALALDPSNVTVLKAIERSERREEDWAALATTYGRLANAVTDAPLRAGWTVARAHLMENRLGDPVQAAALFSAALAIDPHATAALSHLKRLLASQKRWPELVAALREEHRLCADADARRSILVAIARVQDRHLSDADAATATLEQALGTHPADRALLEELARVSAAHGRRAVEASALVRLAELTEDADERATLCHRLGQLHEQELGDEDAARPWYEQALSADPTHRGAAVALARLLEKRSDWTGLLRVWSGRAKAISATVEQADLHHRMGILLEERLGRATEAAAHHAQALGLDAAHHGSFEALARLLAAAGRWHELAELYQRAIDRGAHDAEKIAWLFRLGGVFEDRLADAESALGAYERVLALDPTHFGALHAIQRAASRAGRFERVVEVLRAEASLTKDADRTHALLHRAAEITVDHLGDPSAASRALESILQRAPQHRPSLEMLAKIRADAGQWAELIGVYERLVPLTSGLGDRVRLQFQIGEIQETQLRRDADAIASYRKALALDGDYEPARDALIAALERTEAFDALAGVLALRIDTLATAAQKARAATELGVLYEEKLSDPERALGAYEAALSAEPTHRPALDARERLLTDAKDASRLAAALEEERRSATDPFQTTSASIRRAYALSKAGDKGGALEAFRPIFAARPDHLGALRDVEVLYAGDDAGLAATYRRMADLVTDPKAKLAALSELARAQLATGTDTQSVERQLLELTPHDAATLEALVARAERDGDDATALSLHARLASSTTDPLLGAFHHVRVGEIHLAAEDPSAALTAFRAALALDPNSLAASRGLTSAARAASDPTALRQAARYEAHVTRDRATAVAVLLEAARLCFELDREQDAASAYGEALLLDPNDAEAAMGLMATMMYTDGIPRLVELLTQAAHGATDEGRASVLHRTIALLHADLLHDLPAAIAATRRSLAARPGHEAASSQLAAYLERNGQWMEAVEALERALGAAQGETRIELYLRLARIAEQNLREPERAKQSLHAILAIDGNRPEALTALARIERLQGHDDEALRLAKKLISVVRDDEQKAAALAEMAELEKGRGQLPAAAAAAFSAIGIQGPRGSAARLYRGLVTEAPGHATWDMYSTALMTYLERAKSKRGDIAATYRELARVMTESSDRPDRAIATLREGVKACPHDASISLALVRALRAARGDAEALYELRRYLGNDVLEVGAWRALAEVLRDAGEPEGAPVALTPLVALGQATEDEERIVKARRVRVAEAPAGILGDSGIKQLLQNTVLDDPFALFIPAVGEIVTKLEGVEHEKWGVQKRDRLRAGDTHHVRAFADRIGRIFGVPEFDLYITNAQLSRTFILAGSPPALIVPASIERARDSVLAFHLARPLALLSRQLHPLDHVDEGTMERILVAVVRQFEPGFMLDPLADEDEVEHEARRVGKAIGFFSRGRIQEAATTFAAAPVADFYGWAREIRRLAARAALLISDDLLSVLGTLNEDLGVDNYSSDLVRFWVSDPALRFRRVVAQQIRV